MPKCLLTAVGGVSMKKVCGWWSWMERVGLRLWMWVVGVGVMVVVRGGGGGGGGWWCEGRSGGVKVMRWVLW